MVNTEKQRFAFGENWQDFLRMIPNKYIHETEKDLHVFLDTNLFSALRDK